MQRAIFSDVIAPSLRKLVDRDHDVALHGQGGARSIKLDRLSTNVWSRERRIGEPPHEPRATNGQCPTIRCEVIATDDLLAAGSHAEAARRGTQRLEGKTYVVADGDVLNVRFNV